MKRLGVRPLAYWLRKRPSAAQKPSVRGPSSVIDPEAQRLATLRGAACQALPSAKSASATLQF